MIDDEVIVTNTPRKRSESRGRDSQPRKKKDESRNNKGKGRKSKDKEKYERGESTAEEAFIPSVANDELLIGESIPEIRAITTKPGTFALPLLSGKKEYLESKSFQRNWERFHQIWYSL